MDLDGSPLTAERSPKSAEPDMTGKSNKDGTAAVRKNDIASSSSKPPAPGTTPPQESTPPPVTRPNTDTTNKLREKKKVKKKSSNVSFSSEAEEKWQQVVQKQEHERSVLANATTARGLTTNKAVVVSGGAAQPDSAFPRSTSGVVPKWTVPGSECTPVSDNAAAIATEQPAAVERRESDMQNALAEQQDPVLKDARERFNELRPSKRMHLDVLQFFRKNELFYDFLGESKNLENKSP